MQKRRDLYITKEDEERYRKETHCDICEKPLGLDRVRDPHYHVSGKYRGAARGKCNLNFHHHHRIPVVIYNLEGSDSHLILKALGSFPNDKIACIANNQEKYISSSLGKFVFLDSLQSMNAALSTLVDNLRNSGNDFKHPSSEFKKTELLTRKDVYPHDYMDDFEKFREKVLPPFETFHSKLNKTNISQRDYEHAKKVWCEYKRECKTLVNYHDLYLKTDVLLLADVFESFRKVCINTYKLDPCQYYTAPELS